MSTYKTLPTWNPRDKSPQIEIHPGFLQASYKGSGRGGTEAEAGSIRSTLPAIPSSGIYYFEVNVLSRGTEGCVVIGLGPATSSLSRLPGWEKGTYGYHGEEGKLFHGVSSINSTVASHRSSSIISAVSSGSSASRYESRFTAGDVVGCCINFIASEVFFTKNGRALKVAFRDVPLSTVSLYPMIGFRSPGESIEANFGQSPFAYDINEYISEQKLLFRGAVNSKTRGLIKEKDMFNMVISYLIRESYGETVKSLCKDIHIEDMLTPANAKLLSTIPFRQNIKDLVLSGKVEEAKQEITRKYPNFFYEYPDVDYIVECLYLLECVLFKKATVLECVQYGQILYQNFFSSKPLPASISHTLMISPLKKPSQPLSDEKRATLEEVFSQFASNSCSFDEKPIESARKSVAKALNSFLIEQEGGKSMSQCELIIRQLITINSEISSLSTFSPLGVMDIHKLIYEEKPHHELRNNGHSPNNNNVTMSD